MYDLNYIHMNFHVKAVYAMFVGHMNLGPWDEGQRGAQMIESSQQETKHGP